MLTDAHWMGREPLVEACRRHDVLLIIDDDPDGKHEAQ